MDTNLHGVAVWWLAVLALVFGDPGFKPWAGKWFTLRIFAVIERSSYNKHPDAIIFDRSFYVPFW